MSGATRCNPYADADEEPTYWIGNRGCLAEERRQQALQAREHESDEQRLDSLLDQAPVRLPDISVTLEIEADEDE